MQVALVLRNEAQKGQRIRVSESPFVIGRGQQCHLRSKSRSVSRKHCAIIDNVDHVVVKDLNSSNGTILNDAKLPAGAIVRIYHRDLLQIGKLQFRLSVRDEATELPDLRPVNADTRSSALGTLDLPPSLNTGFQKLGEEDADDTKEAPAASLETREFDSTDRRQALESSRGTAIVEPAGAADEPKADDCEPKADDCEAGDSGADDSKSSSAKQDSGPKKLPEHLRAKLAGNSQDAANDALKRLFQK